MQVGLDEVLAELGRALADPDSLVRAVGAGRRHGVMPPRWRRVELRPVDLRVGRRLQIVRYNERQAFTENLEYGAAAGVAIKELLGEPFGSWHLDTLRETVQMRVTKKGKVQAHRQPAAAHTPAAATAQLAPGLPAADSPGGARPLPLRTHDRVKPRLLDPVDPMLYAVGITTADGAVKADRRDKYHQIEEFLRALEPVLPHLSRREPLRVADLGCGNAYLTFAAYTFLTRAGHRVELVGVDVKEQARRRNTEIAARLGWAENLRFFEGTIGDANVTFPSGGTPDLVLALHACDTATDDALARGVQWQAPVIMAAPCCHHDIQAQLRRVPAPRPYTLLTRHGILRERYADVLTDALRAAILRLVGYRVEVVEFVASRHTPRNVLIRAAQTAAAPAPTLVDEYEDLVAAWHVRPPLAALLEDRLPLNARHHGESQPLG